MGLHFPGQSSKGGLLHAHHSPTDAHIAAARRILLQARVLRATFAGPAPAERLAVSCDAHWASVSQLETSARRGYLDLLLRGLLLRGLFRLCVTLGGRRARHLLRAREQAEHALEVLVRVRLRLLRAPRLFWLWLGSLGKRGGTVRCCGMAARARPHRCCYGKRTGRGACNLRISGVF